MPSFDTVSEIDGHEVTNAVDQANRELTQRFDFKDTGAEFAREMKEPFAVIMKAKSEFQLKQMLDILKLRARQARHRCRAALKCKDSGSQSGRRAAEGDPEAWHRRRTPPGRSSSC